LVKKRKNMKIIKSEKRHAQKLIPVRGQMVKTRKIKDIPRATKKNNLRTSAIYKRKARKNNITIEKIRKSGDLADAYYTA
jgi:hypothetical protein